MDDPVEYPLDGTLDLHVFSPREARDVVQEYLRVCRENHILRVRIIHGKGRSVLRAMIRGTLDREKAVQSYSQAAEDAGGWGATIVRLWPPEEG